MSSIKKSWQIPTITTNVFRNYGDITCRSSPYFSLIPSFSYAPTYTMIGGLIGSLYGYEVAKKQRYNVLISTKYIADLNYGYVMWGGLSGLLLGKLTGHLITWI